MLGGRWAYEVLGWGGYWAWDPVENAAIMPWFTATAYLHSVMIQEKKDMLKVWNMTLVILTFVLTIFGTFLTRSGVISSVHSFTQSGLGPYFLTFLAFILTVSIGLLLYRLPDLKSENEFDSLLSREAAFLFNNLILVGLAFATFWGTIFPILSEWVAGCKNYGRSAVLQPGQRPARGDVIIPDRYRADYCLAAGKLEQPRTAVYHSACGRPDPGRSCFLCWATATTTRS